MSDSQNGAGTPGRRPQNRVAAPGRQSAGADRPAAGASRTAAPGRTVQRPSAKPTVRPAAKQTNRSQGLVRPAPKAKSRKARLVLSKLDPWSVLKISFLLAVSLGVMAVVASIVLWTVLDLTGIFDRVNSLVQDLGGTAMAGTDIRKVASLQQVVSLTTLLSLVNIVLITALSMLAAVIYNLCASMVGGIGVTLTDD